MINQVRSPRFLVLTLFVVLAAATRALPLLIPHIWNFTAVYALAIFAGSQFKNTSFALLMPIAAMALSDLFIPYGFSPVVYIGFLAIVLCGMAIRNRVTPTNVAVASVAGAVAFFLITNFAFLYPVSMYPHNFSGIMQSYIAGLPFLRNALIADLIFVPILFGSFYYLEQKYPALSVK